MRHRQKKDKNLELEIGAVEGGRVEKGDMLRKGTWTYSLDGRGPVFGGSRGFKRLERDNPFSSDGARVQGYATISTEGDVVGAGAGPCLYIALTNKAKHVVGVAHVSISTSVDRWLEEWKRFSPAEKTRSYIVKGDGKDDTDAAVDLIPYCRQALQDAGFKDVVEDIDQPVAGEKRGDNAADVLVRMDGRVHVERMEYSPFRQKGKDDMAVVEYDLTPRGVDKRSIKVERMQLKGS